MWDNRVKLNNGKEPANRGSKTGILICPVCGRYDLPENMVFTTKVNKKGKTTKRLQGHTECLRISSLNQDKLKPMKEGITHCQITGIKFGMGQAKATADHDHESRLFRAVICAALNTLEGNAKFIMEQTGCDTQGIKEYLDTLLAMPGIDLGLEPYPELGYATYEEAEAALNEIKAALNETTD
tara:strand:+ start:283 stop:831 length:549 start_codon:yes stop_codon:yes gene_type:complete